MNVKTRLTYAPLALVVILVAGLAKPATAQTGVYFQTTVGFFTQRDSSTVSFTAPSDRVFFHGGATPKNSGFFQATDQFTGGPLGTVTRDAAGYSTYKGFYSNGSYAYNRISNAYFNENTDLQPPVGWYTVAGMGSRTSVTLYSPSNVGLDVNSVWHWHVSGSNALTTMGTANGRLWFQKGLDNWYDLFAQESNGDFKYLIGDGPGDYTYPSLALGVGQSTWLNFWSSAYWQLNADEYRNVAPGSTVTGRADFGSTFKLGGIDVYDRNGNIVTDWTLVDDSTGEVMMDFNGRTLAADVGLQDVPEPGSIALLIGFGVAGTTFVIRRRK